MEILKCSPDILALKSLNNCDSNFCHNWFIVLVHCVLKCRLQKEWRGPRTGTHVVFGTTWSNTINSFYYLNQQRKAHRTWAQKLFQVPLPVNVASYEKNCFFILILHINVYKHHHPNRSERFTFYIYKSSGDNSCIFFCLYCWKTRHCSVSFFYNIVQPYGSSLQWKRLIRGLLFEGGRWVILLLKNVW